VFSLRFFKKQLGQGRTVGGGKNQVTYWIILGKKQQTAMQFDGDSPKKPAAIKPNEQESAARVVI
jgi:hypothetical protein